MLYQTETKAPTVMNLMEAPKENEFFAFSRVQTVSLM